MAAPGLHRPHGLRARLQKSVQKLQSNFLGLQKAFNRFQKISVGFPESIIINGLRGMAAKKIADPPQDGHGSRRQGGSVSVLANPGNCVSRLRGLSWSLQILARRPLIDFEPGLHSPPQSPVSVLRRRRGPTSSEERIVNQGCPFVKKNLDFFFI